LFHLGENGDAAATFLICCADYLDVMGLEVDDVVTLRDEEVAFTDEDFDGEVEVDVFTDEAVMVFVVVDVEDSFVVVVVVVGLTVELVEVEEEEDDGEVVELEDDTETASAGVLPSVEFVPAPPTSAANLAQVLEKAS